MSIARTSKFEQVVANYKEDHTHPINHFLHLFVGWPMVGASLLLLPFKPWWSLWLFVGGYAFMWFGHFVFERNLPTIFKHPATPFIMARSVIGQLSSIARGMVGGGKQA